MFIDKSSSKKFAFCFVAVLAVVLISVFLADLVYRPKNLVKRGYQVEIVALSNQVIGSNSKTKTISKPDNSAEADINTLLGKADFDAGARIAKKCTACHSLEKGGANKIGPNLFGVVGRKKASVQGFSYSEAMSKKGGIWTVEDLNQFITKPKDFVPGTKMGFAGLKKDKDRANVIFYLKQNK